MSIVAQAQSTSSRIVYSHNGTIYKMKDDGTSPTALTTGSTDTRPTICPSGRAIFFERYFDIYKVGQNGGTATAILETSDYEGDPDCAQFGSGNTYIVFVSDREDGPPFDDVYRMDPDGTNVVNLTSSEDVDEDSPTACGSSRIAFTRHDGNEGEIWTADVSDGGNALRQTDGEIDFEPTCRANGTHVAFSRVVAPPLGDPYVDIFEKDIVNSSVISITDNVPFDAFYPVYSPGGLYVAFVGSPGSNFDIYKLLLGDPEAEAEQLTDDQALETQPAWGELAP